MTTPSGQISAQDIKNEFGETGEGKVALGSYRIQEQRGELNLNIGDGVPGSGTISYDNMRNKRLNIVVDYYADNANLNRAANGANTMNARHRYENQNERVHVIGGLKSKPSDTSPHRVRIHVHQTLGGAKGNQNICALRTGSFNPGTSLIVDVGSNGKIYGGGGNGGEGGNELDAGNPGQDGASALGIDYNGTVINVASGGLIRCGFGGGGGGGSGRQQDKGEDRRAGGGGGGGGQGYPGGSGGHGGTAGGGGGGSNGTAGDLSEAGEGGNRGSRAGQAFGANGGEGGGQGEAANSGGNSQYSGGSGGAQGSAIRKGSGVNWSYGTKNGSVIGAGANGSGESPTGVS